MSRREDWYSADAPLKVQGLCELIGDAGLRPAMVLDVGCGAGEVLGGLCARLGARGVGVDLDPEAISEARSRAGAHGASVHFRCAELAQTELWAELVLCVDVFEHVSDDVGFLRELGRHGDHFAFRIPLDDSLWDRLRGRTAQFRERYGHLHAYTRGRALARLEEAGFELLDVRYHRIPAGGPVSRGMRRATEVLSPRAGARLIGGWSLLVLARVAQ